MNEIVDNRASAKMKTIAKVHVIQKSKEQEASQAYEVDPFTGMYSSGGVLDIIEPPLDLSKLSAVRDDSAEIGPDVDAIKVNVERTGWRIVPRPKIGKRNEDIPKHIKLEMAEVENFFNNCVLDQEIGSFIELRSRTREDLELTGMWFIEILPQKNDKRKPAGLKHIPSWTMRLTGTDKEFTQYPVSRAIKIDDAAWTMETFYASKRFRRYVQLDDVTGEKVYFKEWNDPRPISSKTGKPISEENDNLGDQEAHEVIFHRIYSAVTPYGKPRWYGATLSVYGGRAAEEINYVSLDNNQIPALALLATNVEVTQGSLDRLKEFFEERVQGDRNYARMVIIEAEPIGEGMKDPGSMKLSLEPLAKVQHTDAMFKEYIPLCDNRIRRSWRLPPLMVGASEDYTKATATASKLVAEQQVYVPERNDVDELWTSTIIARLGKAYALFRSNSPELTDGFELTQLLATAEGSGGLTPRTSTQIVEDVMNMDLPEPDESINPDIPFSLTKLRTQAELFQIAQESSVNPNVKKEKYARLVAFVQQHSSLDEETKANLISLATEE